MAIIGLGDEIAMYLDTQIAGLTLGQNLFVGRMPDLPDAAVIVYERGGGPPLLTLTGPTHEGPEAKIDRPRVQTLVKDPHYADAQATAEAIFHALQGISQQILRTGGAEFLLITALQSPVPLGRDQRERWEFSQNYEVLWSNPNR